MGMTYVQKLLAKACNKDTVAVGDILELPVHLAMSHENAALVIKPPADDISRSRLLGPSDSSIRCR